MSDIFGANPVLLPGGPIPARLNVPVGQIRDYAQRIQDRDLADSIVEFARIPDLEFDAAGAAQFRDREDVAGAFREMELAWAGEWGDPASPAVYAEARRLAARP